MKKLVLIIFIFAFCVVFSGCASIPMGCAFYTLPPTIDGIGQKVTVGDVQSYGQNFVGKTVYTTGYIIKSQPASLAENKGLINLWVADYTYPCTKNSNHIEAFAMDESKYDWQQLKKWTESGTLLTFTGKVEMRKHLSEGAVLENESPSILIDTIKEYK